MLGLTKAWYRNYSGTIVPFNSGGGGIDFSKLTVILSYGDGNRISATDTSYSDYNTIILTVRDSAKNTIFYILINDTLFSAITQGGSGTASYFVDSTRFYLFSTGAIGNPYYRTHSNITTFCAGLSHEMTPVFDVVNKTYKRSGSTTSMGVAIYGFK